MSAQTTVSDERLSQIIDHEVTWFDWEVPIIAAELLARRAGERQRDQAQVPFVGECKADDDDPMFAEVPPRP